MFNTRELCWCNIIMCVRCGVCYRLTLTTCDVVCCNVILMSGGVVSVCCNVYAVCKYPKEGS